ncbi:MAG: S8 family serine peptidase [Nitrospinae bacterium]|nr:S8 family serine peptidase [Nitrospinota bacterium]
MNRFDDGWYGARAAFTLNRASICAIVLCAMFVLTNCGGGGGGSRVQPQAAVMPEPQPQTCPPGQVGTPPNCTAPQSTTCPPGQVGTPPNCTAPPPPQKCIPLHDGTCSPFGSFNTRAQQLAGEYRLEDGFKNQWGLATIGADSAYAHVNLLKGENTAPGAGVTIGFIDSGIDTLHSMFAGKTVTEVFMSGAKDETGLPRSSHGTSVASVAAGVHASANSTSPQGVAWGADIAMFAIPTGTGGGKYNPISLTSLANRDDSWASEFNQVLAWRDGQRRVDILNLSIGHKGLINFYSEADLRANLGQAIAAMAQAGASEKAILVWAGGNAHGDPCDPAVVTSHCVGSSENPPSDGTIDAVSVEVMPGLVARIAELRGHTIAVVALKLSDERITGFSNRCGIAADYCIAAPGQTVKAAYFGPDPNDDTMVVRGIAQNINGTSVAAPMVAGGLAIMKQLFRDQLSNTELVTRLFETADNTGVYANRAIYGRGKMDLAAATHPVGVLEVPVANVNRVGNSLHATRLSLGAPLGDGLARSFANREIMVLDDLSAPFWYRLGDFVATAKGPPVDARVRGFLAGADVFAEDAARSISDVSRWSGVRVQNSSAKTGGGHLALAEGGMMATLKGRAGLSASVFGTNHEHDAVGGTLGWRPGGSPLGLSIGWITEDETILGGEGQGAFGSLAADTAFIRIEGDVRLGAWRVGADAEWGSVRPQARGGIIEEVSPISTSAFALHARAAITNEDTLHFSLSQPLRVEDGRASLTLPVARTKDGRVLRSSIASPLAPDERQVDVAASWERPLADGRLRLGVIWSHNPGHSNSAEPLLTFLAGWRRRF